MHSTILPLCAMPPRLQLGIHAGGVSAVASRHSSALRIVSQTIRGKASASSWIDGGAVVVAALSIAIAHVLGYMAPSQGQCRGGQFTRRRCSSSAAQSSLFCTKTAMMR